MTMMLRHLPNLLTTLRLAAAPTTAGLLVAGHFNAAFGLFAVAGLSDAADGFLAKRFGLDSPLGRVLDPIADKALMLAAFVTLALLAMFRYGLPPLSSPATCSFSRVLPSLSRCEPRSEASRNCLARPGRLFRSF